LLAAFLMSLFAALPDALLALWLKFLAEAVLHHRTGLLRVAAVGLAVSATATWFLRTVSTRIQRRFRDKSPSPWSRTWPRCRPACDHHPPGAPDYSTACRCCGQVFVLDHMYMSLFSTCGWILRLAVTIGLLMAIHPALALLARSRCPPC